MNILFLAPEPIYSERGTPIAVGRALRALSQRGDKIDLVTYHRGIDIHYENVKIHRIVNIPFIREIPPGFSWKKIVCDAFMLVLVLTLVLKKRYDLVHAVEEGVFIALIIKVLFKIPYIFDMDSQLSRQMVVKHPLVFGPVLPLLEYFEDIAVKNAKVVVPVCDALRLEVVKDESQRVMVLWDVSLLDGDQMNIKENLREHLNIDGLMVMYVGNLESYQGIDLLLESFALVIRESDQVNLVIIGGKDAHIRRYRQKAIDLGIDHRVHFLGPRPVKHLAVYLSQADILVSPRVLGNNTPMKIFSYLDVGKPLLATDLPTHTQVLDPQVSLLAKPTPISFSEGMLRLIEDPDLRVRLGMAGKKRIEERHTFDVFRERLHLLYDWLQAQISFGDQGDPRIFSNLSLQGRIKPSELRINYQPIVSLQSGKVVGFEALIRWQHPRYGLLYPPEFLSYADETGQMDVITEWALRESCQKLRELETKYPFATPLIICVNLDAKQFLQSDLLTLIDQVTKETDLNGKRLVLEISDHWLLQDTDVAIAVAKQLASRGIRLYVNFDDINNISIAHLNDFSISTLKIEPSFVRRVENNNGYSKLIRKILKLANDTGLEVIAVGVETGQQLAQLRSLNCAYGQGFYFSEPLDDQEVERLMSSEPKWFDEFETFGLEKGFHATSS